MYPLIKAPQRPYNYYVIYELLLIYKPKYKKRLHTLYDNNIYDYYS